METNKFERMMQDVVAWIQQNQERFWTTLGGTLCVVVLALFAVHRKQQQNAEAWNQLGIVQGQLMQGKMDDAKKAMGDWEKRFPSSSAGGYERFLKADLLYKTSDYTQAAQVYAGLADNAPAAEMKPLALSGQEAAEEMAGKLPEAQAAARRFTEKYPDHFLAASAYLAQARLADSQGQTGAAAAAYDRFLVLFPQHPLAPVAKARRSMLGPATSAAAGSPTGAPTATTLPSLPKP